MKKRIDWDAQPLGKVNDTVIARAVGCSRAAVCIARQARNIPSHRARIDWNKQPLGLVTDTALALEHGVDPSSVASQRRRRGLKPATPQPARVQLPHRDTLELMHVRYGLSSYEIAARLGCSAQVVGDRLRKLGISRPRAEAYACPRRSERIRRGAQRRKQNLEEAAE
jgi:DNA-binding CsgD family transcriptional regulator